MRWPPQPVRFSFRCRWMTGGRMPILTRLLLLAARHVTARPEPSAEALQALANRLNAARNPVLVVGSDVDTDAGWKAGVKLAETCGAGVFLVSEPARISFPTSHPNFLGTLGTTIARVREQLTGHDLVLVFGAPAFRYHAWTPGCYLPSGTQLVMITADPDQAARAPMGDAVTGDPAASMERLSHLITPASRKIPSRVRQSATASSAGVEVSVSEFNEVLATVCPPNTAFTSEAPSLGSWWERVPVTRSKSFFCGAGGGLGFALPAAVGVSLAYDRRPVVALMATAPPITASRDCGPPHSLNCHAPS